MFDLRDLIRPVVAAPMAGGVSTPELVAATASAGGLGFLAAGYRTPSDLRDQIARTRSLGAGVFGVNMFVPDAEGADPASALAYRERLLPLAQRLGIALPEPVPDEDAYGEKVAALLDDPVPVVSFTFGCAASGIVRDLRRAGTYTIATVTSASEALQAAQAGVDALVAQGPAAGGHRATFDARATPPEGPLGDLLQALRAVSDLPLIAAGGLATPASVREALGAADAVQLGTALLDADEAGTSMPYRRALRDPRFTETVVTRAFSGRLARGLRNAFIDEFGPDAPASYPLVNQLTAPIRRAAAASGNAELLSLWAGTGWRNAPTGQAATILETLLS